MYVEVVYISWVVYVEGGVRLGVAHIGAGVQRLLTSYISRRSTVTS